MKYPLTYLDQALAGDWGHEYNRVAFGNMCLLCGYLFGSEPPKLAVCPAKVAKFTREKVIAEIEALAGERCYCCRLHMRPAMPLFFDGAWYRHGSVEHSRLCLAQPEQRRLAALRKERDGLKEPGKK